MEFNYINDPLQSYINRLAEKSSCPGGGSASALCTVLSASLVCMAANYTVGSKLVPEESQKVAKQILEDAFILKERLTPAIEKDSLIYEKIRQACRNIKKDTGAQASLEAALKESTELHVELLTACDTICGWNETMLLHCNPNLISDIGVSAALVIGALKSEKINIMVNLKEIKDRKFADEILKKITALGGKIENSAEKTLKNIEAILSKK